MNDIAFNFIQKICIFLPCMWIHLLFSFAILSFPDGSDGKESACNVGNLDSIPGWNDPLEKGMATHTGNFFLINLF